MRAWRIFWPLARIACLAISALYVVHDNYAAATFYAVLYLIAKDLP